MATSTAVRKVPVMMGRCPVGGGKCDKECAVLQVEDEVECSCGCSKHLHQECSLKSSSHSWNSESCECQCKDQTAHRQCMETHGKVWDSSSCSCICQSPESCHNGLAHNDDTCMCEPVAAIEDVDKSEIVREDRDNVENSDSEVFGYLVTHWIEVVIMIVLATAIVILVIVIAILMRRVEKLRRVINKNIPSSDTASDNADIYLSNPAPDMDDRQIKQQRSSKSTAKSTGQLPHKYF